MALTIKPVIWDLKKNSEFSEQVNNFLISIFSIKILHLFVSAEMLETYKISTIATIVKFEKKVY